MKLLIITQKVDRTDDVLGFFHSWIARFADECSEVIVIAGTVGEYDMPSNVRVLSLGKEHGVSRLGRLYRFLRYCFIYRKEYDVVFVHMIPLFVLVGAPLWKLIGKPITLWYTHKSVDWKLRGAHLLVDKVFSASSQSFRLEGSSKVEIVGHGIDTKLLQPGEKKESRMLHLLTISRLSPIKNIDVILSAVRMLHNEGEEVRLDIVGSAVYDYENDYVETLKSFVIENGLEEVVLFHGAVPHSDIQRFLQRAHIFINTSETGSLDKAGLEAMSCGVPLVTSNVAFGDVLEEYSTMCMFPSGNIQELVERIRLFSSAHEREKGGNDLRQKVIENHSLDALIPRLVRSCNTLLAS